MEFVWFKVKYSTEQQLILIMKKITNLPLTSLYSLFYCKMASPPKNCRTIVFQVHIDYLYKLTKPTVSQVSTDFKESISSIP